MKVYTDDPPLTIRSGIRTFWGRELEAHLAELAQNRNTLRDQLSGQVEEILIAPRIVRLKEVKSDSDVKQLWQLSEDQKNHPLTIKASLLRRRIVYRPKH